jgi:hypothetical protein
LRSIILGIAGVVALAGPSVAQTAEGPPPTKEALNFKAPDGFVTFNAAGDDTYFTTEYRLKSEGQRSPSKTLAFQAFRDQTPREPVAFNAKLLSQRDQHCPGVKSETISTDREQGFETAVTLSTCPAEADSGKPRTEFIKSVRGETIFLTVRYTLYAELDSAQKQDIVSYLKTVGLCRRNGGC